MLASSLLGLGFSFLVLAPPDLPELEQPGSEEDPAPVAPAAPVAPESPAPGGGELEDNPEWEAEEPEAPTDEAPAPESPDGQGGSGSGSGGGAPGAAAGGAGAAAAPAPAPSPAPAPAPASPPSTTTPQRPSTPAPAPQAPTAQRPTPQQPAPQQPAPQQPTQPPPPAAQPAPAPAQPVPPSPSPQPEPSSSGQKAADTSGESDEPKKERKKQKLGGFKFFRLGIAAKFGYLSGTSQKEGLFDRDKSIENAVMTGMVEPTGAGNLGSTAFGGLLYGGVVDVEVVGINAWLDFNAFINGGGMWSVLLGYDHEIGFNHWLRLDVGGGFGMMKVFLYDALEQLYLDRDNPTATNIGTTGMEFRGMADLQFRIAGPLFTGPSAMIGYHYLWSANAAEVTKEKGLHFSAAWNMRLDFAFRRRK